MDILKRLKKDHRTALGLIDKLEKRTALDNDKTAKLVTKLCEEVKSHAKAEEKALYTLCAKKTIPLRDLVIEGTQEHHLIEEMLNRIEKIAPGKDGQFKANLSILKELLEHHTLEEEEKNIFPKVKKLFSDKERIEIGKNMDEYKEEILDALHKEERRASKHKP